MGQDTNIDIDNHVDDEILTCLDFEKPKSFFLFAGAGSGKTRTLVNVLNVIREKYKSRLHLNNQRVAIITYTNAACDEIKSRLDYDALFEVSTIHSFTWELIRHFTSDIKDWLRKKLKEDIGDLEDLQSRARGVNKTSIDRAKKIESKIKRLSNLINIRVFTYNPNGDNISKDSLNHSEVIDLGAFFLMDKELMQNILVRKFPILLIDESQDTNKSLIDSFFAVQKLHKDHFSLGLIGDMMQRIYLDGKEGLGKDILPADWETPEKKLNHRCPKRVITLINKIRAESDGHQQVPRSDKENGFVRLFLVKTPCLDKKDTEESIVQSMAKITGDNKWIGEDADVKTLTLEHHMAAKRMGFSEVFEPLYNIDKLKTGLLDGTLSGMSFFTNTILPLYNASCDNDKFAIARIVKEKSPLLDKENIRTAESQISLIEDANSAVNELFSLWKMGSIPMLIDILRNIAKSGLFAIPDSLIPIAHRTQEELIVIEKTEDQSVDEADDVIEAWDKVLSAPFSQIELYRKYITDEGNFGTHQGVKGREFPRVMVILDDDEARGFLFSYEKLFGVKALSAGDLKNQAEGKETGLDRTRRLFYVTCSRAKQSLAVVAYTSDPELFKRKSIDNGWFINEEIE